MGSKDRKQEDPPVKITICMGSSCFARGNEKNLQVIEKFLAEHNLGASVDLAGSRCEELCTMGPNISINGRMFHNVDRETLVDLLQQYVLQPE